jgi:glycosyltransferase involved in cell wall biosynthesis
MDFRYSLVIPIYGNKENLSDLMGAIRLLASELGDGFEVVFVVDASPDNCWQVLQRDLPHEPYQSQLLLHSRNFGSFSAIRTGFVAARGQFLAAMAADLQEPPDLIIRFFRKLEADEADIVFGKREGRSDPLLNRFLSSIFWSMYRKYVITDMPPGGVDIFGCNRKVLEALMLIKEANSSIVAQLFWVGYRRAFLPYKRKKRLQGKSQWNFNKRMNYLLDSIFSFSDLPVKMLLWIGVFVGGVSFLLGIVTLFARILGLVPIPGYTMQILFACFGFSGLLFTQGVIGCYLWRCFENTKNRPLSLIHLQHQYDGKHKGFSHD